MKRCIFIIGMHRSGTSAVAGMLYKGGMCLGKDLLEPDWINPKGYFEDKQVIYNNDLILHEYGGDVWHLPSISRIINREKLFYTSFSTYYNKTNILCLKDPRFCITFPIWNSYFEKFDIKTEIILIKRSYIEVGESLKRVHGFAFYEIDKIINDYERCINWIKKDYKSKIIRRINYSQLLNNPQKIYKSLQKAIDIKLDPNGWKFIDKSLRHC